MNENVRRDKRGFWGRRKNSDASYSENNMVEVYWKNLRKLVNSSNNEPTSHFTNVSKIEIKIAIVCGENKTFESY